MISDKELLEKKYGRYTPNVIDSNCVTDVYQKSFKDNNNNRKYFITWKKYDFGNYADQLHEDLKETRYEGDTQLVYKGNNQYLNITFLDGWTIDNAEKFLEMLFATGWFEKYDHDHSTECDEDDMTRTWVIRDDGSLWWE